MAGPCRGLNFTTNAQEFENAAEYFEAKERHSVLVVFFFDSKEVSWRREQLVEVVDSLARLSNIKEAAPVFGLVDLHRVPMLRDHYDFVEGDNLQLLIANQLLTKENYAQIWKNQSESTIKFEIIGFLSPHFARFPRKIGSNLQEVVDKCRVTSCAIYLGKNETNFEVFKEVGRRFFNITFLFSHDLHLKFALYSFYNSTPFSSEDSLLFLRADLSVSAIDPKDIWYTKPTFERDDLAFFLEFSHLPKLRKEESLDTVLFNLVREEQILVLHCKKDVPESGQSGVDPLADSSLDFHKALEYLPRGLMYMETSSQEDSSSAFMNLLMQAGSYLQDNTVYFIFNDVGVIKSEKVTLGRNPVIQLVESLVDFVSRKRRHLPYFKAESRMSTRQWNRGPDGKPIMAAAGTETDGVDLSIEEGESLGDEDPSEIGEL